MEFLILPSTGFAESRLQFLASYVINGQIAIDAGAVGCGLELSDQKRITDVFLSHSHLDHIATLPIFLDNVYEEGPDCVIVHGLEETLATVRQNILNDRIWPDFVALSSEESPFLKLNVIQPRTSISIAGVTIEPIELIHTVPTVGFVIDSGGAKIALISDTAPSDQLLETLLQIPNLNAIFLECSFPNQLEWLAQRSKHFSTQSFERFARSFPESVRIIAVHVKPAWYDVTTEELQSPGRGNIEIGRIGVSYHF